MENIKIICDRCGKEIKSDGIGTGYGEDREGHKICYACCGEQDIKNLMSLEIGEKYYLYLSHSKDFSGWHVTNWPGTFSVSVCPREGRHNFAGIRRDVWFRFRGHCFHGVQYGSFTEVCHITRVKDWARK